MLFQFFWNLTLFSLRPKFFRMAPQCLQVLRQKIQKNNFVVVTCLDLARVRTFAGCPPRERNDENDDDARDLGRFQRRLHDLNGSAAVGRRTWVGSHSSTRYAGVVEVQAATERWQWCKCVVCKWGMLMKINLRDKMPRFILQNRAKLFTKKNIKK